MTIAENLNRIIDAKEAIKDAIVSKGGQVSEDAKIDEIPAAIEGLPSGEDNLEKLLAGTLTEIHSTTPVTFGRSMFAYSPSLEIADIVISNNITNEYQYANMFKDCPDLTTTPELPAETLASYCYQGMFQGCTSLTTAPELPAETLANYCYYYMFQGCTSLTQAPALPATKLVNYCYQNMFQRCTSLNEAPYLPAATLANQCYSHMFQSCTSLKKTGIIEATGNISTNASNMFQYCTSLKEMTWTATTPPTITSSMWANCPADMIIYVPDESVDKYKEASVWNEREAYIKPISEKYISAELISQDEVVVKSFNKSAIVNCTIKMITSEGYEDVVNRQLIVNVDENLTGYARTIPVPVDIYGQTVTVMINQTANDTPTIRNVVKYGTYSFELNDNGYYESKNYSSTSQSYAYATVIFVPQSDTVTFECINTSNNLASSCYGIISKLNQNLTKSTTRDTSTSLVQQSWYGVASSDTPVEVTYNGLNPGMSYNITVKYIKTLTNTSILNKFQFKVKGE